MCFVPVFRHVCVKISDVLCRRYCVLIAFVATFNVLFGAVLEAEGTVLYTKQYDLQIC